MAYPPTLTDLQNDVLSRLAEAANSKAEILPAGNVVVAALSSHA